MIKKVKDDGEEGELQSVSVDRQSFATHARQCSAAFVLLAGGGPLPTRRGRWVSATTRPALPRPLASFFLLPALSRRSAAAWLPFVRVRWQVRRFHVMAARAEVAFVRLEISCWLSWWIFQLQRLSSSSSASRAGSSQLCHTRPTPARHTRQTNNTGHPPGNPTQHSLSHSQSP